MDKHNFMLSLLLLLLGIPAALADDVIRETAGGSINWSEGVVYANGFGTAKPELNAAQRRLLSRRAAIVDGQRNLLEMTKGVRLTSATKVVDAMVKDSVIATRVEGVVKGAVSIKAKEVYQNDIFSVTLAMPMAGKFLRAVWQKDSEAQLNAANMRWHLDINQFVAAGSSLLDNLHFFPTALAQEAFVLEDDDEVKTTKRLLQWLNSTGTQSVKQHLEQAIIQYETNSVFSGLLVDASTVGGFELATIPKLRNEDGEVIYPSESTSYDDIVNKRGVSYDFDLEDAIRNKRVATTPFIINARSTYKSLASDLVITNEDAERIRQSTGTRDAMNKAGVLIVVAI
jgi:hypothetical protein|tara:strand:+ start:7006 stop:8031 length:1026 start_codon:yes stop_codon:yes gene_type:complete